jgi:hypothetical protein
MKEEHLMTSVAEWLENTDENTWLATVYGPDDVEVYQCTDAGVETPYAIAERAVLRYFTADMVLHAKMLAETLRVEVVHSTGATFGPIEVETSLETIAKREL